ncbi:MAG TPA: hypothetical protein VFJ97_14795 [Dermatophilaceae bacterium]|nr:hypothetical protein [Dermatophilaceae bacterium]
MATTSRRAAPPGVSHSRRAAILLLLGLLASSLSLPYTLVALVPLGLAGWESVRGIRAFSAERAPARFVVWTAFGLVLNAVLVLGVLLPYAFYGTAKGLQDCYAGANTAAARAECRRQFTSGVGSMFAELGR